MRGSSDASPIDLPGDFGIFVKGSGQGSIAVMQQSQQGATVLDPTVELFLPGGVGTGDITVGYGDSDPGFLFLMRPGTGSCVSAIGMGTLNISTAVNTTGEGGSLTLTGTSLLLFHPSDTPWGDIAQAVSSALAKPICPK